MEHAKKPPLALTMGEPGGISAEITVKAWQYLTQNDVANTTQLHPDKQAQSFFVISDPNLYQAYGIPIIPIKNPADAHGAFHQGLPVFVGSKGSTIGAVDAVLGNAQAKTAQAVLQSIKSAVSLCLEGAAHAVVTNPIQKKALIEQGFQFPGHTEYLADLTREHPMAKNRHRGPVMMLAGPDLKTIPASVHIALKDVASTITSKDIIRIAHIAHESLKYEFKIKNPRIAIAGLNPHAGEGGLFGDEDIKIIDPAIQHLQSKNIDAVGPLPADTMFHKEARAHYDVAICMYHDQALIPVKTLDFHGTVNTTLGLPIIRTSPDHGCALDIAGKNIARPDSLISAINLASTLASQSDLNR